MANAIKNLNVSILKGKWNRDLIDEFKDFGPDDKEYDHDDIVDAGSISYNHIFKPQTVLKPRRRRSRR
jgi:phage terminase large subunit-like protein